MFAAPSFGQQIAPQIPTVAGGETAKPHIDKAKLMGTRPAEPPRCYSNLIPRSSSLPPGFRLRLVQILVTGYGALEENNHGQTALMTANMRSDQE